MGGNTTKGVLIVESRPASPDDAAAFHRWYEDTHIPEILSVDGFVSARRFESLDGDSFLVLYEITGDVEAAKGNLAAALKSGSMSRPVAVQLDPPPTMQYLRDIGEHGS